MDYLNKRDVDVTKHRTSSLDNDFEMEAKCKRSKKFYPGVYNLAMLKFH